MNIYDMDEVQLDKLVKDLMSDVVLKHSMPWKVVHRWTWDIIDNDGKVVRSLAGPNRARRFVRAAEIYKDWSEHDITMFMKLKAHSMHNEPGAL